MCGVWVFLSSISCKVCRTSLSYLSYWERRGGQAVTQTVVPHWWMCRWKGLLAVPRLAHQKPGVGTSVLGEGIICCASLVLYPVGLLSATYFRPKCAWYCQMLNIKLCGDIISLGTSLKCLWFPLPILQYCIVCRWAVKRILRVP